MPLQNYSAGAFAEEKRQKKRPVRTAGDVERQLYMSTAIILQQMAVIAVMMMIGFYLRRSGRIDGRFTKQLSFIIANITNPALMISAAGNQSAVTSQQDLLTGLLLAAALYAVLCVLGFALPAVLRIPREDRKFYNMMTVYTNTGFMGIPLAQVILPEGSMIYVIIINAMFNIYIYTHGVLVLGGREQISLKKLVSPGFLGAVGAVAIRWFGITLPLVPANIADYLGNATTFLAMILLGSSVALLSLKESLGDVRMWLFLAGSMLAIPAVITLALRALGADPDLTMAFCLMVAMPAGNLSLILAEKEGYPTHVLAQGIMMTTLVSFLTVTLLLSLLF